MLGKSVGEKESKKVKYVTYGLVSCNFSNYSQEGISRRLILSLQGRKEIFLCTSRSSDAEVLPIAKQFKSYKASAKYGHFLNRRFREL